MKNIRMIVTDLDNTLLRSDKTVSPYTLSVLNECRNRGIPIVFATARIERAIKSLGLDGIASYIISNNGAVIALEGKVIHRTVIPEAVKDNFLSMCARDEHIKHISVVTEGNEYYSNDKDWVSTNENTYWEAKYHDFKTRLPYQACKISVESNDRQGFYNILNGFAEIRAFPNNGEDWYMITERSVSKFNSIAFLSELTGIDIKDIIAFGDDYNDVDMLEKCGISVAVENAIPEARAAAKFMCASCDDDGEAKFIARHIL